MKRDKNGRFSRKDINIEIPLPSPIGLLKLIIMVFLLLPWLYILICRLNIPIILVQMFELLLKQPTLNNCEEPEANGKKPYTPY